MYREILAQLLLAAAAAVCLGSEVGNTVDGEKVPSSSPPCSVQVACRGKGGAHTPRALVVTCTAIAFFLFCLLLWALYKVQRREWNEEPVKMRKVMDLEERTISEACELANQVSDSCAICLLPWAIGDSCKTTPCNHSFHSACLDTWIARSATCAMCRRSLAYPKAPKQVLAVSV
mmetsp:Transcript_55040/g.131164  ORF Transcript_55040/g.131164 Transcript_55040/m.131164 type:complete len:175 (+) Transcript_55040:102-626(+)